MKNYFNGLGRGEEIQGSFIDRIGKIWITLIPEITKVMKRVEELK